MIHLGHKKAYVTYVCYEVTRNKNELLQWTCSGEILFRFVVMSSQASHKLSTGYRARNKGMQILLSRNPVHYSVRTTGRVRISPKNLMTTMIKPDMWGIIRQSVTDVFLYPKLLDTY